ncbi:hypothetical protein D3C73_1445880 [compost metagenome]
MGKLSRVHVPKSIGREVTEAAPGPVNILQYTCTIVWRCNSEIGFILFIPYLRHLAHFKPLVKDHFLDLVTNNDMQIISKLIRLDANQ